MSENARPYAWLALIAVLGLALYASGLGIPYYGDDYQFLFEEPSSKLFHYFSHDNPENRLYRPLQASWLALVQALVGERTFPVQLLQIGLHVALAFLVAVVILALGFTRVQAAIGSVFMLVSQANVHAVLSNDTLSQVGGTLFGCLSVWLAYLYGREQDPSVRRRHYVGSLVCLALALLNKESSVSYAPMVAAVFLLARVPRVKVPDGRTVTALVAEVLPFVVLSGGYMMVRNAIASAQPKFGSSAYDFQVGFNVVENIATFLFGAAVPVSTVTAFVALATGDRLTFGLIAAATLVLAVIVLVGLAHTDRSRWALLLVVASFGLFSLFPMFLMNKISELYVYNMMPFLAVLVGVGVGEEIRRAAASPLRFRALAVGLVVVFTSHAWAIQTKAAGMRRSGEQASALLAQIPPFVDQVPRDGQLFLLNPESDELDYSVFRLSGFNPLVKGTHRINQLSQRDDFSVRIVDADQLSRIGGHKNCLILTMDREQVRVFEESDRVCK